MDSLWDFPDFDEHELVHFVTDRESGLKAVIAVHLAVVGDEQDRGPVVALQVLEQAQDLRRNGHIQRLGDVVGHHRGEQRSRCCRRYPPPSPARMRSDTRAGSGAGC